MLAFLMISATSQQAHATSVTFDFDSGTVQGSGSKTVTVAKSGYTLLITSVLDNLVVDNGATDALSPNSPFSGNFLYNDFNITCESQVTFSLQGGYSFTLNNMDAWEIDNQPTNLVLTAYNGASPKGTASHPFSGVDYYTYTSLGSNFQNITSFTVTTTSTGTCGGHVFNMGFDNIALTNITAPATAPGAPTIGTATAGNGQASVSFTAPASNGGSTITGYTATSNPGGFTGTCASSPCTVAGLTNGTSYTFTVTATNGVGTGPASSASNSVTPSTPAAAPTIGSPTSTSITTTTATLGGTVSSDGGASLTKVGVVYSKSALNANPTVGGANVTEVDLATPATGLFTVGATGLTASTGYSYRAFATNGQGTTYTTPTTFSTLGSVTPPASYPSVAQSATTVAQTITLSAAPASGLTVTPAGTGLTFTPSAISFTSSDTSKTFTVSAASNASAGAHTISYALSGANSASYVTPASGSITVTALSASTTVLSSSPNPSATAGANSSVTLTATVTSGATGTVTFQDGGSNLTCSGGNPATISAGTATCVTSFAATGSHSLTAVYNGDSSFATSTSNTVSQNVLVHPTISSVSPAGGATAGGTSVTITGTNFVSGRTYTVSFGSSTATATYLSATTLSVNSPSGSAGPVSVTLADTTDSTTISGTGSSTFTYGPPTVAKTGGDNQAITVSSAFPVALSVTVKDAGGIGIPNATVTFTAPASGAGGTFANATNTTTATTNASGVATASTFTANTTAGAYTVSAAMGSVSANFSLTNLAGAPSTVALTSGNNQTTPVSTVFGSSLKATVTDAFGNPLSGVSVTFTAPASGASATFSNSSNTISAITNSSGIADSGTFTANSTSGGYLVAAAAGSISSNFSLTNVAAPVVTTNPTSQSLSANSTATFTAAASGNPTPAVQWQKSTNGGASFTNISGATSATLSFTAASGDNGSQYRAVFSNSVGSATTTAATLTVTAGPPVAGPVSATVAADSINNPITLSLSGGAATSVSVASQAAHGTATASGTSITYTPATGYSGSDSFTYTASNTSGGSAAATVSITVNPPPPTAAGSIAHVAMNSSNNPIPLALGGGAASSVSISSGPSHGTVSLSGPSITYTPVAGYVGPDSFSYIASNAGGTSTPATVAITVDPAVVPPVVPSLQDWAIAVLATLLGGLGLIGVRRRSGRGLK